MTAPAYVRPGIGVAPLIGDSNVRGITARALMAKTFAPIKYVVPGYVVEGLTVFAGAPKLGKSWAVLDWAIAVASGGDAFGSIACPQGDVIYLALEDNERRLQSRLRHMRTLDPPECLTFHTEWPDLDGDCIPRLEAWVHEAEAPRLAIIDVFAKVRGSGTGKETAYELDYKYGARLQQFAINHGLAVVLVHHTRKQEADDPFDAVSGTRGLTGAADSVLVLRKDAGSQTPILYGRGRDLEEIESALEFQGAIGKWKILGDAGVIAKTSERREILAVLARAAEPMTPTEIADALGKQRSNVNHMLAKLLTESKVLKHPKGKYSLLPPCHSTHSAHSDSNTVSGVNGVTGGYTGKLILAAGEIGDDVELGEPH